MGVTVCMYLLFRTTLKYLHQNTKSPFTPVGTEAGQTLKQRLFNYLKKKSHKTDSEKVVSRRDKVGYEKKGSEGKRRRGNNFSLCDQRKTLSGVISLSF